MNYKQGIIIVLSLLCIFTFLYVVYLFTSKPVDTSKTTTISKSDHVKWSQDKKRILVEYTDLECPACKSFHELLSSFEATNSPYATIPRTTTLVSRHFPLYQIHPHAFTLAYAAEAASYQNKYFAMQDIIFKNQSSLQNKKNIEAYMKELAKEIGLDVERFMTDMNSQTVQNKVNMDLAEGESLGINGTPTYFLNGKKLEFRTIEEFIPLLKP